MIVNNILPGNAYQVEAETDRSLKSRAQRGKAHLTDVVKGLGGRWMSDAQRQSLSRTYKYSDRTLQQYNGFSSLSPVEREGFGERYDKRIAQCH